MQLVYKVLVSCLPDVHVHKLLNLVRLCFPNKIHLSIGDLRLFNYAIVSQQEGNFVGVIFVKETHQNLHELQHFCVLPRFRNNSLGSELIRCCQSELQKNCMIGVKIDPDQCIVEYDPKIKTELTERLVSLFQRHAFVVSEREENKPTSVYLEWHRTELSI